MSWDPPDPDFWISAYSWYIIAAFFLEIFTGVGLDLFLLVFLPLCLLLVMILTDPYADFKMAVWKYPIAIGVAFMFVDGGLLFALGMFLVGPTYLVHYKVNQMEEYMGSNVAKILVESPDVWTSL